MNRLTHRRLVRRLFSRDEAKRNRAATALIAAEDPRTTRRLERLLEGQGRDEGRAAAAQVLGFGGEVSVAGALVRRLAELEESVTVRAHAAEALGHLLQHEPVLAATRTTIGAGLQDREPEIRFWCAFAAAALNLQELRARLERLREDGVDVEGWWTVGEEADWALRCLDGEEDPPLPRAL